MSRRKIISYICMGLFFFFSGVEYAVILPTLNGYLKTLDAQQYFLGLVMSAFSLTGLLAAPVYGRISDKTRSTKFCVIIANFFEIGGNFLYFASRNKYTVLAARLIAGIGSGVASSIFGMITRTTSEEERTKMFSFLLSVRQIGLIFGPAFNIFLHDLDWNIGPFHVDEFTSPGLLMAIIWFLHTILVLIAYKETENKPQKTNDREESFGQIVETDSEHQDRMGRSSSIIADIRSPTFVKEFLREEVVVCLAITFMVMFSQAGLETSTPPVSLLFFNWGGLENSYLFCGASAVVVAGYLALGFLSKKFSDRSMMLAGCIGMVVTYLLYLSFSIVLCFGHYDTTPNWVLPLFLVSALLLTVSLPFLWVPQAALFSKITSRETQAFNQGIRLGSMGLGQILGPIWASSLVTYEKLPIMVAVNLFLFLMLLAMIILSYRRLQPSSMYMDFQSDKSTVDETTPLISGNHNDGLLN